MESGGILGYMEVQGFYRDNGKENGKYYIVYGGSRVLQGQWKRKWKVLYSI